ncbi:MAG: DUF4080 domain-containing protein [Eubacteriales bacterium]|nr:DUF4080 domain-containing protein [Eubacteriales bacterium]
MASPKVALIALNAQFAHTSLAIRQLREYACLQGFPRDNISLCEWTINDLPQQLLMRLFAVNADVYAFSCYIWNRRLTERLTDELKKIRPEATIIWGGPEASQDARLILKSVPAVDAILAGEGEVAFADLLLHGLTPQTPNVVWRNPAGEIQSNPMAPLLPAEKWPFPYTDDELLSLKDRLLYFETSRGCPYGCTYCLSSLDRSVRLLDLSHTTIAFERLIAADVRQIKLVDRTFNIQSERALDIWRWLIKRHDQSFRTNFHFEIMADRLTHDAINILEKAPAGLFQFEIGVQTTTPEVLKAIRRPCDWVRLADNVRALKRQTAIHLHLDLIAGLPGETPQQFANAFDDVFSLDPEQLQLGFLKVLPGSPMADQAKSLGFKWSAEPPYEILASDQMTFADLACLKDLEAVLELYHNSGRYPHSLKALLAQWSSPFAFFAELAAVNRQAGWFDLKASPSARTEFLDQFARARLPALTYLDFHARLKLDYLLQGAKDQPLFLDPLDLSSDPVRLTRKQLGRERMHRDYPRQNRFRLEDFLFADTIKLQAVLSRIATIDPTVIETTVCDCLIPAGQCLLAFDLSGSQPILLFSQSLENIT